VTRSSSAGFGALNSTASIDRNGRKQDAHITSRLRQPARLYWENGGRNPIAAAPLKTTEISVPVAITVFPGEAYRTPETWARRAYPKLTFFHEVDKGGHFAAWEQPELFSAEMRAAFRPLRQSI
jgi:pimeloyl-ACP methyl ester carboxylesterase